MHVDLRSSYTVAVSAEAQGGAQSWGRRLKNCQPNRSTLIEIIISMDPGDYDKECSKGLQNSGDNDADATKSKGELFMEKAYAIHQRDAMERTWRSREKQMLKWKCSKMPTMKRQLQNVNALDLAGTQDAAERTFLSDHMEMQRRRLALSTTFPSDNTLWEIETGDLNERLATEGVIMPPGWVANLDQA